MTDQFFIKRNDRRESIERILRNSDGTICDLSTASGVKFIMKGKNGGTTVVNATAQIVNAAAGHVRYSWGAGDTGVAGTYDAEWQVTFNDNTKQTFPNDDNLVVYVLADLAD